MKKINISLIALATLFMVSCGDGSENAEKTEAASAETPIAITCNYGYDASSTKLTWKAFKTSAKIGVGGSFDDFTVEDTQEANSEIGVFDGAIFTINTGSVNSGNTIRDPKIIEFFFNTMMEGTSISGSLVKMSEPKEGKGAAIMSIMMNGETHEENATYTLEGNILTLSATLDLVKWNANNAVASLNKACELLHAGEDGVSQLWSEVEVEITTTLKKDCK